MADTTIAFCERCGRDRDVFRGATDQFRVCPRCGAACCPDCWNQTGGGCLACIPFSLPPPGPRRAIAPAPVQDPAAGGRGRRPDAAGTTGAAEAGDGVVARRSTPKPISRDARPAAILPATAASGYGTAVALPTSADEAVPAGRRRTSPRRRAARFLAGVAMSAVVVVGVSVAAFGATWPRGSAEAPRLQPAATTAPTPDGQAAAEPTANATQPPAASSKPHPSRTAAPANPRPVTTLASERPASPRRTAAPVVIVAPPAPTATPRVTPAPTAPPPPPPTDPPPDPTPEPPAEPPEEPPTP